MSFSADVKSEICSQTMKRCCLFAQMYGMLIFAKRFSSALISLQTESADVAECFIKLCNKCFDIQPGIIKGGIKKTVYVVSVMNTDDCRKIMSAYGVSDGKRPQSINFSFLKKDCCKSAFLRGAFLSSGAIFDPEKGYHARFIIKDDVLAQSFLSFLDKYSLFAKSYSRNGNTNVYFKGSGPVEDFLSKMNVTKKYFELMDTGVIKSVKNRLNRQENCIMANMDKTVDASYKQRKAIEILQQNGKFSSLSPEVQEAARIRVNNPDSSLNELCKMFEPPLTKSALSRRLKKITDLAEIQ